MAIRSEQSQRAILDATMALLDDRRPGALSVQKLSIERVAREAGVSKTTIYRWWPSKAAMVIDTFLDNHIARTPVRQDVPAIEALEEHLGSLAEIYGGREGRLVAQLIAECQYDPAAMAEFKARFWNHRQEAVLALIDRAVREGSLRGDVPPPIVAELMYSPIYFRLLLQTGPLDRKVTAQLLTAILEGIRAEPGLALGSLAGDDPRSSSARATS